MAVPVLPILILVLVKPNVTVSGTLRNDKNGLVDGLVNGAASRELLVARPVYAYLTDVIR